MGMLLDKFGARLLTIQEVAQVTQMTVGTLYHLVSQQRIPGRTRRKILEIKLPKVKASKRA